MPEQIGAPLFLLSRFAEYYEEVESIKLAVAEGRLGALLSVGDEATPTAPDDVAVRICAHLGRVLIAQEHELQRNGDECHVDAYRQAKYVMAALTDELFIFEIAQPGRDAWMETLLEYHLFKSRNAGVHFFELAEALLASTVPDPLQADVAAVMVMALRLGFKGQYRGGYGEETLRELRGRLFRLVERVNGGRDTGVAFPQTTKYLKADGVPQKLAPLSPWYVGGLVVLLTYLVISTIVWFGLISSFETS